MPGRLFARYPVSRQAIVVLHDVAAVTASLPLAVMLRESQLPEADRLLYLLACLPLLAGAALAAVLLLGSYRAVWRYLGIGEIVQLAQFVLVAILLFYVGQFLIDRLAHLPRSAPPIHFLVAMFLLLGARIAYGEWCRTAEATTEHRPHRRPLLLIGAGDCAALLVQMLAQRRGSGYEPVGILCDDVTRHRSIGGVPILGALADIDRALANLRVQGMTPARIIVTRPHHELGRDAVYRVMQRAWQERIPVEQLPDLMRFRGDDPISSRAMPDSAHEQETHAPTAPPPAADPTASPSFYHRLKRGFDVVAAAAILLAASPLLALAALAVATCIQRPVLFVQYRPGLARHPFRLLKLRTMKDPTAPDGHLLTDAERTPWIGRLLRRTRLDELPQLLNVLKGDMALIGPRPLVAADLDAMPDGGRSRSRTRPGLTGWAQVNGGHQLHPHEKHALDRWYAENADIKLDAAILWRTVLMMLLGEKRDERAITSALAPAALTMEAAE